MCLAKQPVWQQVWAEEFNGPELDKSQWQIAETTKPHNNEQQAYRASHVRVEDGNLVLSATNDSFGGKPFSSGKVVSIQEWRFGRWEVRAKLPSTRGTWPAIWILPDSKKYRWPSQGEIDILENRGDWPHVVSHAFHYGTNPPYTHKFESSPYELAVKGKPVDFHQGYHTYAAEWDKEEIRFFVDGAPSWTVTDEKLDGFLSHQTAPMQVILNLAVGGDYVKEAQPDATSNWPQHMLVDYVRVFQRNSTSNEAASIKAVEDAHIESQTRAMTFNIRLNTEDDKENAWRHRSELVLDRIRHFSPDILGLQEVLPEQSSAIAETLTEYNSIGGGRDADGGGEASPILYRRSRYEVLASGMFWLSNTPEEPGSMTWGNHYPRICTWARLFDRNSRHRVLALNTHWDHESQPARLKGAKVIAERLNSIAKPDEPILLLGDFNVGPQNPARHALQQNQLREAFLQVHDPTDSVGTYHNFKGKPSSQKIDAILVSGNWKVLQANIDQHALDGRYPSDHFPVTAVLELQ
ncbi:Beta-glucanase precursor [Adhaeretor mobilis]|uniref:Beta-glucanase n=2 Tax=Adhaeretor mobilis TaxID=1930276 RepID=A0A517N113_9BACT|nr:Beta-glucanase precursor [Adhaeretor mobilis]